MRLPYLRSTSARTTRVRRRILQTEWLFDCRVAGLVLRHPWATALRGAEAALQAERQRLGQVLPRSIGEYNAAVALDYFKINL
jgi:hypothetical protein